VVENGQKLVGKWSTLVKTGQKCVKIVKNWSNWMKQAENCYKLKNGQMIKTC
jgi:hypothetical protein